MSCRSQLACLALARQQGLHFGGVSARSPFDQRGHHGQPARASRHCFDERDARRRLWRAVDEPQPLGVQPLRCERRQQAGKLLGRVDEVHARSPSCDLARCLDERHQLAAACAALVRRHLSAPGRDVRGVADHQRGLASARPADVAHVATHDLPPVGPAVRIEVAPSHGSLRFVDLDKDHTPSGAQPEQRESDCANTGTQVERQRRRVGTGRETRQQQGIDVRAVAGSPLGLKKNDASPEEGVLRSFDGNADAQRTAGQTCHRGCLSVSIPARKLGREALAPKPNDTILESSALMAPGRVSFSDQVRVAARRLGFDAVGITRANVALGEDFPRYQAFIRGEMHGEMGWLARHENARERLDHDGILAGAKSVICVARRYGRNRRDVGAPLTSTSGTLASNIARYARGRDYHGFLRRRLRRLAAFVRSLGMADRPVSARPLCDEEPILERAWALRAGIGFVGKNGMLIVPGLGSMVLLGEVVTTLELDEGGLHEGPQEEPRGVRWEHRCGSCTRCLDACPTRAFVSPFVLDARRCVSYLTIEHRTAIPLELREGVGEHLFGCDDCQTACPFNLGTGAQAPLATADGDPFAPLQRWSHVSLESLLALDQESWSAAFRGTPLRRAGRSGIARNAAIVLGNRGDRQALPALRAAARGHDDPMVREAAAWAVARLEGV